MKNGLASMILAEPAQFHGVRAGPGFDVAHEHFAEFREPLGKISEQFSSDFAFVAARSKYACDQYPTLRFGAQFGMCVDRSKSLVSMRGGQSSRISSVKRLCSFMPAAPSSVRMALAVRPCRPITLPRSSGWTRNSSTITCEPSTEFTLTSSG